MEEQAASPWGMIIGIAIGVALGFLVVWGAWKLMPHMYRLLFGTKGLSESAPAVKHEDESEP